MLIFRSFLLVQHESILGLQTGNIIIKSHEIVFQVFELEEFSFQG